MFPFFARGSIAKYLISLVPTFDFAESVGTENSQYLLGDPIRRLPIRIPDDKPPGILSSDRETAAPSGEPMKGFTIDVPVTAYGLPRDQRGPHWSGTKVPRAPIMIAAMLTVVVALMFAAEIGWLMGKIGSVLGTM
jgi:hypothetical protein